MNNRGMMGWRKCRRGAVSMEYILVGVLVAVACLVAVVCVNRALVRDTDVMQLSATGQIKSAAKAISCPQEGYRVQVADDVKESMKFAKDVSKLPD